ncbi:appetite-regulating hormone precursor [Danio rerio]|uniref:Ghrelin n=1 Tax=Danio rerio TaxID=7955 RepID=Q3ZV42_DANRE|nr:ghrelin/obestatin prepropeptide precursor [Danio rerio]ACJ76435.1 ghrelin [Danio rerio]ACJ76436.1 ghrelin [Danio rerio]CAJ20254.1 preproghrelin [Danio rerio]|eukprot:NP_001077341.1 ghrelin/obestatin prepropeptide precursor [Danio rerio]
MPLRCRASSMFLLLCVSLSLCLESVSGGTSFLSPTQKPQGRRPPRVGRREAADPEIPVIKEDDRFMMSAPFELSMSLSEAEYEKYGPVLQNLLEDLLRDSSFEF